eukprot:741060_1
MTTSNEQQTIVERLQNEKSNLLYAPNGKLVKNNPMERTSSYEMEERVNNILSPTNIDRESSIGSLRIPTSNGGISYIQTTQFIQTTPLTPENELSFEYINNSPSLSA